MGMWHRGCGHSFSEEPLAAGSSVAVVLGAEGEGYREGEAMAREAAMGTSMSAA
jgi:hypothetical protein